MTAGSEILNVVIDERKRLDNVDDAIRANFARQFVAGQTAQRCVFKDYIESSEVYYIDHSLNA